MVATRDALAWSAWTCLCGANGSALPGHEVTPARLLQAAVQLHNACGHKLRLHSGTA